MCFTVTLSYVIKCIVFYICNIVSPKLSPGRNFFGDPPVSRFRAMSNMLYSGFAVMYLCTMLCLIKDVVLYFFDIVSTYLTHFTFAILYLLI